MMLTQYKKVLKIITRPWGRTLYKFSPICLINTLSTRLLNILKIWSKVIIFIGIYFRKLNSNYFKSNSSFKSSWSGQFIQALSNDWIKILVIYVISQLALKSFLTLLKQLNLTYFIKKGSLTLPCNFFIPNVQIYRKGYSRSNKCFSKLKELISHLSTYSYYTPIMHLHLVFGKSILQIFAFLI